jgi:lysophospholipase L1-like esterase
MATTAWIVVLAVLALVVVQRGEPTDRAAADEASSVSTAVLDPPVVTFIGDSWTAGTGASDWQGYAVQVGEHLGWEYHVLGVGGSGYLATGLGAPFAERIPRALATGPDVIVVQGSTNDSGKSLEALVSATRSTLTRLRAEADPDTAILVLGASYTPGLASTAVDGINAAVAGAAAAAGVTFVDIAAQKWADADDPTIWADPSHPDDRGHQRIADRLEPLLQGLVGD